MMEFQQSEATAARRRVPVHLVDATDGLSAETGVTGTPQISKNGASFGNTSASLTEVGNGGYYVELTAGELDTLGFAFVRFKTAATAEYQIAIQVKPNDPYDSVRLGLTALPNAAAEAAGGLITRGTGTGQLEVASGRADVDVEAWRGAVPNVLVSGRVDSRPGALAADVITAAAIAADAIGASELAADAVAEIADGVWDEAKAGHVGAGSFGEEVQSHALSSEVSSVQSDTDDIQSRLPAALVSGRMDSDVGAMQADVVSAAAFSQGAADKVLEQVTGTADSGSTTTIVDAERTEADDDYWKNSFVQMTSGGAVGQIRRISAFTASTDTITVAEAFTAAIATGNTYRILRTAAESEAAGGGTDWTSTEKEQIRERMGLDGTKSSPATTTASLFNHAIPGGPTADSIYERIAALDDNLTLAQIADAIWDEAKAGHVGAGSFGEEVQSHALSSEVSAVETDTQDIQSRLPAALVGGRIDASVGAMAAAVLTATAIATDAITAAKIAADAIGASELATDAAQEIADELLDRSNGIETSTTLRQAIRLILASAAGKLAGAATTTVTIRDTNDTKNRITATVDADGNRSAVSYDKT